MLMSFLCGVPILFKVLSFYHLQWIGGFSSRYVVDGDLQLRISLEENRPIFKSKTSEKSELSDTFLYWVPDIVKEFSLPAGFPGD